MTPSASPSTEDLQGVDRRERGGGVIKNRGGGEIERTLKHWIEYNKQNEITDISGGLQAAEKRRGWMIV